VNGYQRRRYQYFNDFIPNEYLPADLDPDDFTSKNFHKVLIKTIKNALDNGLLYRKNLVAKILSSFVYKDGQKMLTISCILLSEEKLNHFEHSSHLVNWEFYYAQGNIFDISLPSLSVRERVEIERLLPHGDLDAIKSHLGFQVTGNTSENDLLLKNFIEYHARFPWFGKIAI